MIFRRRPKVFVIGRNKTGTTTMAAALEQLGYRLGDQGAAERLIEDWAVRDFRQLIRYCRNADAFQDVPFSLDFTYQAMDQAFPDAKFILTVRSSPQAWYDSVVRFHTQIVGKNRVPTGEDLREFGYRWRGWLWRTHQLAYGIDDSTVYDRGIYIGAYENHNATVEKYFRHRPGKLLVLNVGQPSAARDLSSFLGAPHALAGMPHLNKSE